MSPRDSFSRPAGQTDEADSGGSARGPTLWLLGGLALALAALLLAAATGAPYLSFESINPWIVVFSIGLFAALFATPFVLRSVGGLAHGDGDQRWERALLLWGAVTVALLVVFIPIGLAAGFSSDSLFGSVALVVVGEAVLVLGTLVAWLLSG